MFDFGLDITREDTTTVLACAAAIVAFFLLVAWRVMKGSDEESLHGRTLTIMAIPVGLLAIGGWGVWYYTGRPPETIAVWDKPGPWGESERAQKQLTAAIAALKIADVDTAYAGLEAALESYRRARNPAGEARALALVADIDRRLGRVEPARTGFRNAVERYRHDRNRSGLAEALRSEAELERQTGNAAAATGLYLEARDLYRAAFDRAGETYALLGLAELARTGGDQTAAMTLYTDAQRLARTERDRIAQGLATIGLGDLLALAGRTEPAHAAYEDARDILREERRVDLELDALIALADLSMGYAPAAAVRPLYEHIRLVAGGAARLPGLDAHAALGLALVERKHGNARKAAELLAAANDLFQAAGDAAGPAAIAAAAAPTWQPTSVMRQRRIAQR